MSTMDYSIGADADQSYESLENGGDDGCGENAARAPFSHAFSFEDWRDLVSAQTRLAAAFWSVATLPLQVYASRNASGTGAF